MPLTIYITCAIFGTLVTVFAENYDAEDLIILAVTLFMAIFGWVGIIVTIVRWLFS